MSIIILFAPSFPALYKSLVLPVSLSSLNVITSLVCVPVSRDLCCLRVPCSVFSIKVCSKKFLVSSFLIPVFLAPLCNPGVTEDSTKIQLPLRHFHPVLFSSRFETLFVSCFFFFSRQWTSAARPCSPFAGNLRRRLRLVQPAVCGKSAAIRGHLKPWTIRGTRKPASHRKPANRGSCASGLVGGI